MEAAEELAELLRPLTVEVPWRLTEAIKRFGAG
jgi:hypothetical protein